MVLRTFKTKDGKKDIIIRYLREDDTDLLYELFQGYSERSIYFFHPHKFDYGNAERITSSLANSPDYYIIAVTTEGEATGYAFWVEGDKPIPGLGIGVKDKYHELGIGTQLMETMIELARQRKKKGLRLTVLKDNFRAQYVYKKVGFKFTGEETEDSAEFWMELTL